MSRLPGATAGERNESGLARFRERHRWFVRRKIGLGWRPASWQAWAVTALAVAGVATSIATLHKTPAGIAAAAVVLAAYFGVAFLTGGPREQADAHWDDADGAGEHEPRPGGVQVSVADRPGLPAPRAIATLARRASSAPAAPPGAPILVVDRLSKRFGERVAVSDVSFAVAPGEVFGFLGPNGAGKTTTVRMLGTLLEPSSGSAVVAGIPLEPAHGVEIRQSISIMPESPGLYLRLTVAENLEFFAGLYGIRQPAQRITQALEAVNLAARAQDPCGSLSKGLRQRVGLARALLNDPKIIFLDEPTSGLDPVASNDVHGLVAGLREQGVTIFLTTHRLEEAEALCDRVAIMNTSLRTVGRPDELREQLFSRSLVVHTASPLPAPERVFDGLPTLEGWQSDEPGEYLLSVADPRAAAPALARALVAAGADVLSLSETRHTLEDVYFELISDDVEAQR